MNVIENQILIAVGYRHNTPQKIDVVAWFFADVNIKIVFLQGAVDEMIL